MKRFLDMDSRQTRIRSFFDSNIVTLLIPIYFNPRGISFIWIMRERIIINISTDIHNAFCDSNLCEKLRTLIFIQQH